jgi:2-iminobutanoate/2-iminopropanoate deaminase
MEKSFVRGERPQKRAYSPAVITDGVGKIIWIAGHTGYVDDNGKSLAGDFDPSAGRPSATSNGRWGKLAPRFPTW